MEQTKLFEENFCPVYTANGSRTFRGVAKKTKQLVYGEIVVPENGKWFINGQEVFPNATEGFLDFDSNGKEIFEGDAVIDENGNTYTAMRTSFSYSEECLHSEGYTNLEEGEGVKYTLAS